ncbi:MAG: response regulator [Promethearchaeota archaeon]
MTTIFIVDDTDSLRELYKRIFTRHGFNVIGTARNGVEAVELYKTFPKKPDIIIMDYHMPMKNGIEASREILRINSTSKIILVSSDTSVKELALSIGVTSFNVKPCKINLLINNLNKLLI